MRDTRRPPAGYRKFSASNTPARPPTTAGPYLALLLHLEDNAELYLIEYILESILEHPC